MIRRRYPSEYNVSMHIALAGLLLSLFLGHKGYVTDNARLVAVSVLMGILILITEVVTSRLYRNDFKNDTPEGRKFGYFRYEDWPEYIAEPAQSAPQNQEPS